MEPTENTSTRILASRLNDAKAKVAKANARLTKAGIAEQFSLTVSDKIDVEHTENGFTSITSYYDVDLNVPSIGYNGWTFVATLSFEDAGTVVRTVPGQSCNYRPTDKVCDQCHTARERKDTFVVRNDETGEYKQVGRNCLALFFGVKPVLWVFSYNLDELGSTSSNTGGISYDSKVAVSSIVAAALAATDGGRGYKSAAFEGDSTKSKTLDIMYAEPKGNHPADVEFRQWLSTKRDEAQNYLTNGMAQAVIETAKAITGSSEYADNIRILAQSEYVDHKNLGLVASFVSVYERAQKAAVEAKAQDEAKAQRVNEWVGTVGEKLISEGVITNVMILEGHYGYTTLIEWVTTDGFTFKWFATGKRNYDRGDKVRFQGTIKNHEVYNGYKSTILTRCKEA